MANDNKAVGPSAAAKLVTLIKDETAKKYDKTGGKIDGSAEITGGLKVGMSSEFSSSIKAGSEISSDMLLMAPIVALHDPATEESISFGVSGENAAKVTSPVSGGGTQYARLSVGTPTGDNDAATKKYVDERVGSVGGAGIDYFDVYAEVEYSYVEIMDGFYVSNCLVTATFTEIKEALDAGKTPRIIETNSLDSQSLVGGIMSLYSYDSNSFVFTGVSRSANSASGLAVISIHADGTVMYRVSAGELPAVKDTDNGKYMLVDGGAWKAKVPPTATQSTPGFMSAKDKSKLDGVEDGANKTVVDAALDATSTNPVQNKAVKAALDTKAGTAVATASSNGLMSKDDKAKLDGVEDGANKTTVDAALDAASENPVQNKAVKTALDGKLSTLGGEISGHLEVGQTVSAEGSVSVGRTSADTGIHFEKAASNAGRISHGSDPMTGVAPIARLKVADPTEDDDAATKAYVDGSAVRYDAAQTLESAQQLQARQNINAAGVVMPQFQGFLSLAPANGTLGTGVGLSPTRDGNNYALDISDVNEGTPTLLTGVKTPNDADTNAAATVEYVKAKISEVSSSGGVDVDNALSATSTNPVQNKVITSALSGKADKSELGNKADKTALDAKADKTALDAKMDKSGGTFTGNVSGKYFCGTWLQSTAANDLGRAPGKIAVLDDSGWVYYRTPAELLADIGGMPSGDYYTKAEVDAAIAVRASTSVYGTTKLSNSTTSSSKTLAATPYAVKTALAKAKAYVDSAIAVAINSAY